MTLFIADASSNNGRVDWLAARAGGLAAGIEKVTQGHNYVNPLWAEAKGELLKAAALGQFLAGSYLFMDGESSGATQAGWFAEHAGDLDEMFIMVDVERVAGLSPSISQAQECVRILKRTYGRHKPIAGYAPHWYTGAAYLGFFDVLVGSSYVGGTGRPADLYEHVPASWWESYGQHSVDLLQFSPSVRMEGFPGPADCSAWRGSFDELRTALMGRAAFHGHGFRREATGEKSLDQVAADRGTTAAHIAHVTLEAAAISDGHRSRFAAYWDNGKGSHLRMPRGMVYYTSTGDGGE